MTALSAREHACMALIAAFDLVEKRSPSLREIAKVLGVKQRGQAERIVLSLTRRGLITRNGGRAKGSRSGGIQISQAQSFQEASTQQ